MNNANISCMCMVQESQISPETEAALKSKLTAFSDKAFGAPIEIDWIHVPKGGGFTEAKPSTSSIVSMNANKPLDQETRIALLNDICDFWMAETGCSLEEVVAVIRDP